MRNLLVTVDARDRVWLRADPSVEIVPSIKAWRRSKKRAWWRCHRGRTPLGPWQLTTSLAIAAAGL